MNFDYNSCVDLISENNSIDLYIYKIIHKNNFKLMSKLLYILMIGKSQLLM